MPGKDSVGISTLVNSLLMLFTGTASALIMRYQSEMGFKYSLTSTLQMFVGEYLNVFALLIPLGFSKAQQFNHFLSLHKTAKSNNRSLNIGIWRLGMGGFFDVFATVLSIIASLLMPASIASMLRNGTIIFVMLFTLFYLKKPLFFHNWVAMSLITIGFLFVGAASFVSAQTSEDNSTNIFNSIIGILMLLVSFVFTALQFAYQEDLMDRYEFDPCRLVFAESVVGIISLTLGLFVSSQIRCPHPDMCTEMFDNPAEAMMMFVENRSMLIMASSSAICLMIYNLSGLYITKNVSSFYRIIIDSTRTVIIWSLCIIFGLEAFVWPRFVLQAPGFGLLILGSLVNNKIITLPSLETKTPEVSVKREAD